LIPAWSPARIAGGFSGERISGSEDHGRLIAEAARRELAPLGFRRKGRSRLWFADRGYWLSIVEFQPSAWSKGSYLNVAAHFLWSATPEDLTFDLMISRKKPWIEFVDPEQFAPLAGDLATTASLESRRLWNTLQNLEAAASVLAEAAQSEGRGWTLFHAGVASGLTGDPQKAHRLLSAAHDSMAEWRRDIADLLLPYLSAIAEPGAFSPCALRRINDQRAQYGLSPLASPDQAPP
jgi:hypothetical protein